MTHRPGLLDITLIQSFAEADEILKSRDFRQDQRLEPSKAPSLQGDLNSLHGREHLHRRRAEGALFRRPVLLRNPAAIEGHPEADMIVHELGLFLTASVNTTTVATPKTIESLLLWLEAHPEDRPRLDDETFSRQAAQEALRLFPTVPYLLREAERDCTLSSGRYVAQDSLVRIDIAAANRDPLIFGADADRFDPHRQAKVPRRYGLSFGGGIHMCIGLELTTGNQTGEQDERTTGMVIQILRELFAAGIELIPNDPPRLKQNTTQHKYDRFAVTFSRL